jgi:hypothetical protein
MSVISLEQLSAGMCVAADVLDRSGRLLLGAGAEIQEKHLKVFRAWGVCQVEVASGKQPIPESSLQTLGIDTELRARVEAELARRFVHTDREHPAIQALFALCVEREACQQLQN